MSLESFITRARADVDRLAPAAIAAAQERAKADGWDGRLIGEPMPTGEHLYAMARQMVRPVARGDLELTHAYAALIAATLKAERDGRLNGYRPGHVINGLRHSLRLQLEHEETRRDLTAARIRRVLRPLIAAHKPRNVLFAEAHGVNGADDFPFSEPEVTDLVTTEVYYSLPPAPRGRLHAR